MLGASRRGQCAARLWSHLLHDGIFFLFVQTPCPWRVMTCGSKSWQMARLYSDGSGASGPGLGNLPTFTGLLSSSGMAQPLELRCWSVRLRAREREWAQLLGGFVFGNDRSRSKAYGWPWSQPAEGLHLALSTTARRTCAWWGSATASACVWVWSKVLDARLGLGWAWVGLACSQLGRGNWLGPALGFQWSAIGC